MNTRPSPTFPPGWPRLSPWSLPLLALLALASIGLLPPRRAGAIASPASGFAGSWRITEAVTPGGKPYTGSLAFEPAGAALTLRWNTTAGSYTGVGLTDEAGHLAAGWGGAGSGVVVYHVGADGTLDGRWAPAGQSVPEPGRERARGGTPGILEGDYAVAGTNPGAKEGGRGYSGRLRVERNGETYRLRWTLAGTPPQEGVGLRVGDNLFVGYGTGAASYGVISYTLGADGATATGVWSEAGANRTGKENLARER